MCEQSLLSDINILRSEIKSLRFTLTHKEERLRDLEARYSAAKKVDPEYIEKPKIVCALNNDQIERYSRQLILPEFGVSAQLALIRGSFLIVGVGGLGCPAAQYLAAAGCGRIGLVDYDVVERSNTHRQILHTNDRIGLNKVESARRALLDLNPKCKVDIYPILLNHNTALEVVSSYDVVLDCSDNVPTRYLLNDACVIKQKPLIFGSALQMDGQVTVYNYKTGPCYRCIFPVPPPIETVTNCGDGGVLGAVTGVIGTLQALEAIKIVTNLGDVLYGRLVIFDGMRNIFRNIKLRLQRDNCEVCSDSRIITSMTDYEHSCGMLASDKCNGTNILEPKQRILAKQYADQQQQKPHLLIDVRQPIEFEICHLPEAINVPLKQILNNKYLEMLESELSDESLPIVVLCRRGNDSQLAVAHLCHKYPMRSVQDIIGGLHSWHYNIDRQFPIY